MADMAFSFSNEMVKVGELIDPEIVQFQQQKLLHREVADLKKQVRMKEAQATFIAESCAEQALTRLGLHSGAMVTIAVNYDILVPQWLAEEAGLSFSNVT